MYLMSIKPKYAYRIFAGIKKYELRRWFGIKPEPGSLMVVYASGNVRSLIGEFTVGKIIYGPPNKVWEYVRSSTDTGIYPEDKNYIMGNKPAMAIEVLEPKLYKRPIALDELRRIIPDFNPPMSFRELSPDEPLYRLLIRKLRRL
ncbi:DNA-binding protein [Desulfurococcaceae archaeon MEX13E-LK6-19]|nr:DNA-binding protein [Desulfurococcaceae archaeon MEX13E-LK6-19]